MSVASRTELTQDQASNLRMLGCGLARIRGNSVRPGKGSGHKLSQGCRVHLADFDAPLTEYVKNQIFIWKTRSERFIGDVIQFEPSFLQLQKAIGQ